MLTGASVSLDRAPPLDVPMRFFLAAPPCGLAAGLLLLATGDTALASRWTPAALATTHLLVLGFITSIMCGSLMQLVPVLLGGDIPHGRTISRISSTALCVGSLLLAAGFYSGSRVALLAGASVLVPGLLAFVLVIFRALLCATVSAPSRAGVMLAVAALGTSVALGATLSLHIGGLLPIADPLPWVAVHLGWGLIGWMAMLTITVGGELMPMFYVTPALPVWARKGIVVTMACVLVLFSGALLGGSRAPAITLLGAVLVLGPALFAVANLNVQHRRRRRRPDATLQYWWVGQAALAVTFFAWLADMPATVIGVLGIVGSGMSLTTGALFKIVPFLSWLHLQQSRTLLGRLDIQLPPMAHFLPERHARWQLALLLVALLLLCAATAAGAPVTRAAGLMLALASLTLWVMLVRARQRFREIENRLRPQLPG